MKELTIAQTKEMLLFTAHRVIDSKDLLTELDSAIGDGDHGIGMALGMTHAISALEELKDPESVNSLFRSFGSTLLMSMGGASGVVFGTMFQGGARKVPDSSLLDAAFLQSLLRISLDSVKRRGGAACGDKTMVDAFEPAVCAIEQAVGRDGTEDLGELLAAAEAAAHAGMEATRNYPAKLGRAKTLGDRSLGHVDAGSASVWIIFRAMKDYVSAL